MPRHNRTPANTRPLPKLSNEKGKVRHATKQAAEQKIKDIQKYQPDLELSIYQSQTDRGWYLTSRSESSPN